MSATTSAAMSVVALAGGVGGARLVDGLDQALPPSKLTAIVNTSDDFEHWGLHISPDVDTVMYTLAGLSPEDRGWGIEGDTFETLASKRREGSDEWFQLGDRDLETHRRRTQALANGESLTAATRALCKSHGVERPILPMSNAARRTFIQTTDGRRLPFQHWLVRERGAPSVRAVEREGSTAPSPEVLRALDAADLVVICPSNPYVSIDPILELDGVRDALRQTPVVAVSPIVGERAVKGPLATMIEQLEGRPASAGAVAAHYGGLLSGFAVHTGDAFEAPFPVLETNILIQTKQDRLQFARELLELAMDLT